MGKVLAEAVGLRSAPQPTLGVDPTAGWRQLTPDKGTIQNVGKQLETIEDNVHSKKMTRQQGSVIGWKVNPSYGHNFSKDWADQHAEAMFRCAAVHPGGKDQRTYYPTAVVDGGVGVDSFTVPALGDLPAGTLIAVKGSSKAQNNAVFKVSAGSVAGSIKVPTGSLVAEADPPDNMTIDVIGFEGAVSDIEMDATGNLISTVENFTLREIPVDSRIIIGTGVLGNGANLFSFATRKNNCLAYVKSVTANMIELRDHCFQTNEVWAPVADDGDTKTIRIIFGSFYRNYTIDHANYSEKLMFLELEDPRAGSDNTTRYTECEGLALNTAVISAPLKNKITVTPTFVGTDASDPLPVADRLPDGASPGAGPGTAYAPLARSYVDTADDIKLIRMYAASGTVVGEINSWTLTINNGVSPKEVQGEAGAIDHHWGEFGHTLQTEAYYNNAAAITAAANNDALKWDAYARNHQFAFNFELPRVAIRNPGKVYEANMQVKLTFDTPAFENEDTGICGALTLFGFVPDRS